MVNIRYLTAVLVLLGGCYSTNDCYYTKCVGTKDFNQTYIDCDQSVHSCAVNGTGYPSCNETVVSGGEGVNCTHTDPLDFYCTNNVTSGEPICMFTPEHDCYSLRCYGTGAKNATFVTCDGSKERCSSDKTGTPICLDDARSSGIDCNTTKPFYCAYDESTLTVPTCKYPEPHDCFNTKCGDPSQPDTLIDCPQDKGHCSVNATDGSPICVASNTTTGDGISCSHQNPLDFYCTNNATSGEPSCSFTPKHDCYSLRCYGTGAKNNTFIACDGSKGRCGTDKVGNPLCLNDARGSGVDCNTTKTFYCSYDENSLTAPSCKYTEPYDCFNTKCGDPAMKDNLIDCPQDKGHCSVNATDGSPICVASNTTTGDGVFCTGKFTCKDDAKTGVAACHTSSSLLPLWVVLGIIGAVAVVVVIVWVMKSRNRGGDQTPLL